MKKESKIRAEEIADKVCSSRSEAKYRPYLSGAQNANTYYDEYMREVYWNLVDFDENIIFITAAQLKKINAKKIRPFFDGKFVKIFKKPYLGTRYTYYIYCAPLSKTLGSCYKKAREMSFKFY